MGGNAEYLSDGLTEELINRLSHSPNLKVISRTSSFYFKGKQVTLGEIANTLHVGNLLEGSVRRSGNELRIAAQLIRTSDGTTVWSTTYERNLTDVFKLQAEIASTVARELKTALGSESGTAPAAGTTAEAYNLELQGNYFYGRMTQKRSTRRREVRRAFRRASARTRFATLEYQSCFRFMASTL